MNSEIIEGIMKRRREDDEDMMLFIWPILHEMHNRRPIERKQRHSSILYGKKRVNDILTGHVKNCLVAYRMEPHIFRYLASYLRREKLILDTRIKVEEKLAFFLYMVSHNASYEDLQLEFQHSGQTFHEYINEFFNIVPFLASQFLKPLSIDEPHPKISTDERFYPSFQNCLGAIDGSHVPITATPGIAAPFRNRKGTLTHNIMVACDFDLRFTFISCGWEGSATDARVLQSAMIKGFKVPEGKFYLVDEGYANTRSFLAPYRGVRYHLKEFGHGHARPQNHKELFNHRHAILRNHVERSLGILKKRFPILHVGTLHTIENQVKLPAAVAVLHNIKMRNGDETWLDNQPNNIAPNDFVDLPNGDENNYGNNGLGNTLRDEIAMQMWEAYHPE